MSPTRKFAVFAVAFAIAYPVIYVVSVELNLALFTYHAALGQFGVGPDKPRDGPAMYWFGWIATSAIGAFAIATLATYLPDNLTGRLPATLTWLVPLAAMVTAAAMMGHYFAR